MLVRRILEMLGRRPENKARPKNMAANPELDRAFSATQNCDVKESAARSSDIEMVPPSQR